MLLSPRACKCLPCLLQLSDPASGELAPFDVLLTTYSMYERDGPDNKIDRQFVSR